MNKLPTEILYMIIERVPFEQRYDLYLEFKLQQPSSYIREYYKNYVLTDMYNSVYIYGYSCCNHCGQPSWFLVDNDIVSICRKCQKLVSSCEVCEAYYGITKKNNCSKCGSKHSLQTFDKSYNGYKRKYCSGQFMRDR